MKFKLNKNKQEVPLTLSLAKPKKSATGKTFVVASTNGSANTGVQFEDKDLYVTASVYFRKPKN